MKIKITLTNGKELLGYSQKKNIADVIRDTMYTDEVFIFDNICEPGKLSEDFRFVVRASDIHFVAVYE